jgi:hypothetical protein
MVYFTIFKVLNPLLPTTLLVEHPHDAGPSPNRIQADLKT